MAEAMTAPVALGANREQIFALAEKVAVQVRYKPGDNLRDLVEKLGGKVSYSSLDNASSDSGSVEIKNGRLEIFLALDTSPLRDRFTIAHELGHWVLHYLYPKQQLGKTVELLRAERYGTGPAEIEANWFAAAFLMPAREFSDEFKKSNGDFLRLSQIFKVSKQAASIRADTLGLHH